MNKADSAADCCNQTMCQQGVLEIGSCLPWPLSGLAVAANNRDKAAAGAITTSYLR